MLTIPESKLSVVHHYLNKNVSVRQYYFHNEFGSDNWRIELKHREWVLHTDPKHEVYIALKFL
jgi:hypothetical protein